MIDPTEYVINSLCGTGINRATAQWLLGEHDAARDAEVLTTAAATVLTRIETWDGMPAEARALNDERLAIADLLRRAADTARTSAVPVGVTDTPNPTPEEAS